MSAFADDIVLFVATVSFIAGAIVATIGWVIWAWRAMNPKVSPNETAR